MFGEMATDNESGDEKHERKGRSFRQSKKESKQEKSFKKKKHSLSRSPSKQRSRSRSPSRSDRRFPEDERDVPSVCNCLGVFGLSSYTEERDLKAVFTQYGPVDDIFIIYDRQTGRSKGFGFVYFKSTADAIEARKACQGLKLDGRSIRVDYSLTSHPHPPTPGRYMGKSRNTSYDRSEYQDYDDYEGQYNRSRYRSNRGTRDYNSDRDYYREYNDEYRRKPHRYSPYHRHY